MVVVTCQSICQNSSTYTPKSKFYCMYIKKQVSKILNSNRSCMNQFSSVTKLCPTLYDPMNCSTPSLPVITNSQSSLRLMSIESVMPSSHLLLCRPFLLLPPILPSIRVFSNESTLHMRWPKYWSFSFSIIPSKEHPGLISFRMDWLDLFAVQGTLKSLLQHHSSKASILWSSALFIVLLISIHDFWKNHSLD